MSVCDNLTIARKSLQEEEDEKEALDGAFVSGNENFGKIAWSMIDKWASCDYMYTLNTQSSI